MVYKMDICKKIKAVIFDFDGVLVDTEEIYVNRMERFYQNHGIRLPKEILNATIGGTLDVSWKKLKSHSPKAWDIEFFKKTYREYSSVQKFCYRELLNEGALEMLGGLRERGYLISLASSTSMEGLDRAMNECNLKPYFTAVLSGEMFAESKPNPEIYLRSAEILKLHPWECVVVEDSPYGIQAGKDAGMQVIAKYATKFEIDQSKADYFIHSLKEVVPLLEKINA